MKHIIWPLFGLLLVPMLVQAETVLRISDSISLDADQTVADDFYGFTGLAGPISLSGEIEGDAYVIGSSVTANGSIGADLFVVGGATQVHGSVADDVRVIGGEVTIAEKVGGDVFVIGGTLTVLSSAEIAGDVFFYGGKSEINGVVKGSVFGTAEDIRIDGPIGGNIDVIAARALVLGDRAQVAGTISYESSSVLLRSQNAVVEGDIVHNRPGPVPVDPKTQFVPILVYAFSVLVCFVVLRARLESLLARTTAQLTQHTLVGMGAIIALPFACIIALLSGIGALVGVIMFFLFFALLLVSFLVAAILCGALLSKTLKLRESVSFFSTVLGIGIVSVAMLVPFVGPVLIIVSTATMLGAFLSILYRHLVRT